ncbi:hypothetical protein [Rhodopirellula sp. MGV]|uniref:hypothetical protein n=1 Tax=Rhodopirellula sp. MGV TaxID=2023130 RepID=UPI0013040F32|nr:hypothetical protein [Rhodopirellula sp. MGV]
MIRTMRFVVVGLLLILANQAYGAIVYEVFFDQDDYRATAGDTVVANLMLRETVTDGDVNRISPTSGLGSANVEVTWSSETNLLSSQIGLGFIPGTTDSGLNRLTLRQIAFPPGVAGAEVSPGAREVSIGTFQFQVPDAVSPVALITPNDPSLGADFAIAATPTTVLDDFIVFRSSTITAITAIPEPGSVVFLSCSLGGILLVSRRRRK